MALRVRMPTPGVAGAALPSPRSVRTGEGGLESVARGVGAVGEAAQRWAVVEEREREDAQALRIQELEGEYTGYVQEGLHNAQNGLLAQQGRNASAASVPFYEALESKRQELLERLSTDPEDRGRRVLAARLEKLAGSARSTGESHVMRQNDVADDASFAVLKAKVKDRVATDAFDPTLRQEAMEQLVPFLRARAQRKGLSAEDAAGLEAEWRGEATETILNRLIARGSYAQARNLLADPKVQEVLGEKVAGFEKQLVGDERAAEGAGAARGFVRAATNREGMFNRSQAQGELDRLLASDAADEVKKAAEQEFGAASQRAEQAWTQRLADTAERALTKIVNGGGSLAAAKDERRWLLTDEVNGGAIWLKVEAARKAWLREKAEGLPETPEQRASMVDFLVNLPTSVQKYAAKPESFKLDWMDKLSPKDLERAAGMVAVQGIAVRKPDETLSPSVTAAVTALGDKAGSWGKKGPTSPEQKDMFYRLHGELLEEQARLKVAGTPPAKAQEQLLDYARKRLREGRVMGTGLIRDDRTTELEAQTAPGYADKVFLAKDDEKRYREKLRGRGFPETDEWIRWLHFASQGVPDEANPMPDRPSAPAAPGGVTPQGALDIARGRGAGLPASAPSTSPYDIATGRQ